jgi:hypothetical protein
MPSSRWTPETSASSGVPTVVTQERVEAAGVRHQMTRAERCHFVATPLGVFF